MDDTSKTSHFTANIDCLATPEVTGFVPAVNVEVDSWRIPYGIVEHFQRTYRRNHDGRFVVQLPFRESLEQQMNSRSLALKRFLQL